jgi:hypothetical protein
LSKKVLETGIVPTLDRNKWQSDEIPFSKEEIDRVFPGRAATRPPGTWFLQKIGQPYLFTPEAAQEINRVKRSEVKKAINIAVALKNAKSRGRLN